MDQDGLDTLNKLQTLGSRSATDKTRIGIAENMGELLNKSLNQTQKNIALEIIGILVHDETVAVRAALARKVAASENLPPKIARQMALDIEAVSLPVLKLSPVLTDEILQEVIETGIPERLAAIARRSNISITIANAIVEAGQTHPIALLIRNPGAEIGEMTFITALELFGRDEEIAQAIVSRQALPPSVLQVIRYTVEEHVMKQMRERFDLPDPQARTAVRIEPPNTRLRQLAERKR